LDRFLTFPFSPFECCNDIQKMKTHGGKRQGAGRPKGTNQYGESTRPVRIPVSQVERVLRFVQEREHALPLYASGVSAGFPSPADDYLEGVLDLNAHLVREPSATFFVRARGDSMIGAGIHDGDLLVVDRSAEASHGKVVIVSVNGELTVKRLERKKGKSWLLPENPNYPPIALNEEDENHLWGVVTNVIHSL
jgi:DNA polymerase V